MTKNLITGGGGFVASHLIDYLLEKGEEVYITYRWNEDLSRIQHIKDKINLIPADLTDLRSLINAVSISKPDYIFHLAAESYVNDSYARPYSTIMANTVGTLNLLEAVRIMREIDHGLTGKWDPVIHVCSSSEAYGQIDKQDVPVNENQSFRPQNPYGMSKVGADMIAYVYWKNYGIKTIRTRMFTHTGPRRTMLSAEVNFAKQIAEMEKINKEELMKFDLGVNYKPKDFILKHGNLNSIRTFADVRDAVRAYYLLVRKCKPGEVYNIGGNNQKSIKEVLEYLISLSPIKDRIQTIQDKNLMRPSDITLQIPDCSKFIKQTGWKPKYSFNQTMKDLLNWYRENEM